MVNFLKSMSATLLPQRFKLLLSLALTQGGTLAGLTRQRKYCLPSLPSLLGPSATSPRLEGDSITAVSHYLTVGCLS